MISVNVPSNYKKKKKKIKQIKISECAWKSMHNTISNLLCKFDAIFTIIFMSKCILNEK